VANGLLCSLNLDHQAQSTRSRETRCDNCTRITPSEDLFEGWQFKLTIRDKSEEL